MEGLHISLYDQQLIMLFRWKDGLLIALPLDLLNGTVAQALHVSHNRSLNHSMAQRHIGHCGPSEM
jgi:hypothetical protein